MRRTLASIALSSLLMGCPGGGDNGPASSSGTGAAATTVSGSVQAPNGQIAFDHPRGLFEGLASIFLPTVYASISGLSPVPDGTQVQLARLNPNGTGFSVLATTITAGGTYSFDLTNLGLQVSNDLIVRVANGASQMRGFVTGSHVDLDPVAESSVRLVLQQLAAIQGGTLGLFSVQELADITGSVNAVATINRLGVGTNLNGRKNGDILLFLNHKEPFRGAGRAGSFVALLPRFPTPHRSSHLTSR